MSARAFFDQMYPIFKILLVFFVIIDNINITNAHGPAIDKDHLKEYPYCGRMKDTESKIKSRVVNSKDSEKEYRWVALLIRTTEAGKAGQTKRRCTGSVITDR